MVVEGYQETGTFPFKEISRNLLPQQPLDVVILDVSSSFELLGMLLAHVWHFAMYCSMSALSPGQYTSILAHCFVFLIPRWAACNCCSVAACIFLGMINLSPLSRMPFSKESSCCKFQYARMLVGQSFLALGHPAWTVLMRVLSSESFVVSTRISSSFWSLAGR